MTKKNDIEVFQAHSQEICELYLDGQPYDRLRVVNETRFCMAQSAEAMLEAGKRLVVLKEHEGRGDFVRIVEEQLGMNESVARRLMQAAAKFLSPKLQGKNQQLLTLGKSKLYELMVEDDDDLEALADGGTVAGLDLDEVDRMSCRELRKALRKARQDSDAKEQVIADKNKKLDELASQKAKLKPVKPDEESSQIRAEAAKVAYETEAQIRHHLHQALSTALGHAADYGIDIDAWLAGQLNQIDSAILHVREMLGVSREAKEPWMEAE